jgi:hypothetical protein
MLTLYSQNTKFGLKACQICWGFSAWKPFVMNRKTSVPQADELTNFPQGQSIVAGGLGSERGSRFEP